MVQATHQNSAHHSPVLQCVTHSTILYVLCKQEPHRAIIITGSKEQPTATKQGTAYKAQHTEGKK